MHTLQRRILQALSLSARIFCV